MEETRPRIVRESRERFGSRHRLATCSPDFRLCRSQIAGILFLQHRPGEPAHFPEPVFSLITGLGFSGMTCVPGIRRREKKKSFYDRPSGASEVRAIFLPRRRNR